MLKTSIRRILALVCVISLMMTNCFVLTPQVVAEAGDETPATLKSMMQEGYTVVTPQTFGMSDSVVAGSAKTSVGETISIDKLLFGANVTYNGSGNSNFYYLRGKSAGNSTTFQLNFRTSGNYIYFYNYINYNTTGTARNMYIGDDGIDSTSSSYYSLSKAGAGVDTFKDKELQIWLTTEFVKAPWLGEGEAADDLKIGVWFNGKLYNNEYFYVLDCKELVYREYVERGDSFAISSPVERFEDVTSTMPEGYKVVTPLTFGMSDSVAAGSAKTSVGETISIDKLLFSANVTYNGSANSNFYYLRGKSAGNSTTFQLNFRTGGNYIYFYNYINYNTTGTARNMYIGDDGIDSTSNSYYSLSKAGAGVDTFKDKELQIWLTTEFVKAPWLGEGEAADDLKIGVWFNGKLYNNEYFYVLDCKELVYREYVERGGSFASSSSIMEPNDMGMIGGEYASANGNGEFYDSTTSNAVENKIMNGTTFQSGVRFEGEGGTLYYGSKIDANAIKLTSTTEGILVTYGTEELIVIKQNTAGINALNTNFNLKLETKFVDCDADEQTDDVQLGIYVDNKYKSFDLVDAAATLTATIGVKTTGKATVLVGDFASTAPEQVSWNLNEGAYTKAKEDGVSRISVDGVSVNGDIVLNTEGNYSVAVTKNGKVYMEDVTISGTSTEPPENPDNPDNPDNPPVIPITPLKEPTLPEITFSDFGIFNDTYGYNNKSLAASGKYSEGVANHSFVGTVNFNAEATSYINIGGVDGWHGVRLSTNGTDTLSFAESTSKFTTVKINLNDVPGPLRGNDVRFKLAIEVVNLDNDNQLDDVRFWLYFEDVLYQGKPIVEAVDYAQHLGNYLGIYSSQTAASVTIKSANSDLQEEEVDFSVMGFTKDWKQTLTSTKGTASGSGSSINRAPYTGEQSTAGIYLVMSVLSLAAVAYVLWVKRSKVSE